VPKLRAPPDEQGLRSVACEYLNFNPRHECLGVDRCKVYLNLLDVLAFIRVGADCKRQRPSIDQLSRNCVALSISVRCNDFDPSRRPLAKRVEDEVMNPFWFG
jgi:hypothetical protein